MGGQEVLWSQSPAAEEGNGHNSGDGELDTQLGSPGLDNDDPGFYTVHGHPITISQCTFQAHIAR